MATSNCISVYHYAPADHCRRVQEGVIDSDIKILAESVSWQLVRWGVAAFIMMDVVLCARVSPNLQTFFCRFSTWVDLVSFCPLLLTLIPPIVQSHQQDWLEPVRMAPLLRTYRVMLLAEPKTMVYEAIRMIWCALSTSMCLCVDLVSAWVVGLSGCVCFECLCVSVSVCSLWASYAGQGPNDKVSSWLKNSSSLFFDKENVFKVKNSVEFLGYTTPF